MVAVAISHPAATNRRVRLNQVGDALVPPGRAASPPTSRLCSDIDAVSTGVSASQATLLGLCGDLFAAGINEIRCCLAHLHALLGDGAGSLVRVRVIERLAGVRDLN